MSTPEDRVANAEQEVRQIELKLAILRFQIASLEEARHYTLRAILEAGCGRYSNCLERHL